MPDKQGILNLFFNSTGLIVDDEIYNKKSRIAKIKDQFERHGVSFVTYDDIPDRQLWGSFRKLSFLIIDWKIENVEKQEVQGNELGTQYRDETENSILEFITYVQENYLIPTFIFSQEHIAPIKEKIMQNPVLKTAYEKKQLVVYSKIYALKNTVAEFLFKWCKSNPTAYTLKSIDSIVDNARIGLFKTLNKTNPTWPLIVYQTIKSDNSNDVNNEFGEFIVNSLFGRIDYGEFDDELLSGKCSIHNKDELLEIYSNSKLFTYENQQPAGPHTGDLYFKQGTTIKEDRFLLNITAGCDLRNKEMILLKGRHCDDYSLDKDYGILNKVSSLVIPLICKHTCVEFLFKGFKLKKIEKDYPTLSIGDNGQTDVYQRIGRLTHPYITTIQERFSHYICRQGFSRHPNSLLKKND